ncbi:MAG: hypothetical protein RLZ45_508 [Verrucomicrobiota bacterium]|jgi:hypothetical protein
MPTLFRRLGTTSHCSPLTRRLKAAGLGDGQSLMRLAVQRGCRYYQDSVTGTVLEPGTDRISNEELCIGLLHGSQDWSPALIRMGAAMLGAHGNRPDQIVRLARMERSEAVVRELAKVGNDVEPDNRLWSYLLEHLPERGAIPAGVLPHPTRFFAMTAITREGRGIRRQWIRPNGSHG